MKNPTPPRRKSPRTRFTRSPSTWVAMITTASLHPQRRRLNHPVAAIARARAEGKKESADSPAERRELPVSRQIESPRAIEERAWPG